MSSKNVFIVESNAVYRFGLSAVLGSLDGVSLCGQAPDISTVHADANPDLFLCNGSTLAGINGIERIREVFPTALVLGYLEVPDSILLRLAILAGAQGLVSQGVDADQLKEAVEQMLDVRWYLGTSLPEREALETLMRERITLQELLARLSTEEQQLLKCVGKRMEIAAIARELNWSSHKVVSSRKKLLEKLGLLDIADMARFAQICTVPLNSESVAAESAG